MFIVSTSLLNLSLVITGPLHDIIGPKKFGIFASLIVIIASLLFAFSDVLHLYLISYSLLAVGGVSIFLTYLHISNVYPKYRSYISTLLISSQDTSAIVFLIFQYLYYSFGISLKNLFIGYSVLPFLHLIFAWVVQPERIYLPPDSNFTAKFSFRGYFKQMFSLLTSLKFWLFVIWGSVGLTSSYFYMSTLHSQLLWRFDDKNFADSATVWFSTLLFFAGLFSVPITGWIYKKSLTLGFFVITISNITYIILSLIQVATLQYFTFVLFIFSRTAFFWNVESLY